MFPENKIIMESEVITLILGLIVLVFLFMYYNDFKQLPYFKLLTIAYCLLVISFAATVLEGIFWPIFLNYTEHICNAVSSFIVVIWFWKVFNKTKEAG